MRSGVATFDFDIFDVEEEQGGAPRCRDSRGASSADDIALAPATLRDRALTSPNVAVRLLRISP